MPDEPTTRTPEEIDADIAKALAEARKFDAEAESTETLLEAFTDLATVKGPSCGVARILARLTDADRQLVQGWLVAPKDDVGHAHIARTLTRVGHRVDATTVGRHRRGECLC